MRRPIAISLLLVAGYISANPAHASPAPTDPPATQPETAAVPWAPRDDVSARLAEDQRPPAGLFQNSPISAFERAWRGLNDQLEDATGLRLGLEYTLTFQAASSGSGNRSGAAGDFDLLAAWRIIGAKDEPNQGTLNLDAQLINLMGETSPAGLYSDIGAIWATSDGFDTNEPFSVIQLYYEQKLLDDRVVLVLGRIDTRNYISTNRFSDDSLYYMNRAFSSNPALNYNGNGLGAVLAATITDQFYVGGCIADANAVNTHSPFDSIDAGDYLTAVELGFTPNFEGMGEGNYRVSIWHTDQASELDIPEDHGVALSIDQDLGNGVVPFFRYAWSDGDATGVPNIVAGGVAFEGCFSRADDVLGLGLSWGESTDPAYADQVVSEAFYRLQVAPSIQWTFGAQLVGNALDAETDQDHTIAILELRLRVTF